MPRRRAAPQKFRLPLLNLRWYQREVFEAFDKGAQRLLTVWPRRHGKDLTAVNLVARQMYRRVGTYFIVLPYYAQARKIYWEGRDGTGKKFIDYIPPSLRKRTLNQEMLIETKNGSIMMLVGSDNMDAVVGTNPIGVVMSEYSLQDPVAWDLLRPVLRENGGWALFNGTPRGRNHLYELFRMAEQNPSWWTSYGGYKKFGVLTDEDIQEELDSGMDPDLVEQEFNCSWAAGMKGAYYTREIEAARKDGRITEVPYDPNLPVFTFWDLGHADMTACWFVQFAMGQIRVIDYMENHSRAMSWYLTQCRDKYQNNFAEFWLPHDAKARKISIESSKSMVEMVEDWLHSAGMPRPVEAAPRPVNKDTAIELGRQLIYRAVFDAKRAARGIRCLENYSRKWDEKRRVFMERPEHNWASHGADGWQTMALSDIPELSWTGLALHGKDGYDEGRSENETESRPFEL